MQLPGVAVERAACARDCFAQTLSSLLHLASAAFQNPHPGLGRRAVEERQMDTEPVVGVVLRTGIGHELGEPLLTGVGEPVDAACATHLGDAVWSRILDDPAVGLHASQWRIQRAVREGTKSSQYARQSFAQLVTVHG